MADSRSAEAMQRIIALLQVLADHPVQGIAADALLVQVGAYHGTPGSQRDMLGRDLKHLRKVGCVIDNVAEEGADARYVLRPGDDRVRVTFEPAQLFELQRAAVLVGGDRFDSLAVDPGTRTRAGTPVIEDLAVPGVLGEVQRAVSTRAVVKFDYAGRSRTVHPYGLRVARRGWVLEGWEQESGIAKGYSLQRMAAVQIDRPKTAAPPERSARPTLDPLRFEIDAPAAAVLQVPTRFRHQVDAELHHPLTVKPGPVVAGEATEILEYRVTNHLNFAVRLLRLDERVTLQGGERIRSIVADMLRELLEVE
jgi:predicted DNA-binding transcriptional regulator YafY